MTATADPATPGSGVGIPTQAEINSEMAALAHPVDPVPVTRTDYPPYRSSILRHPTKELRHVDPETLELWGPCFSERDVHPLEADLTLGVHDGWNSCHHAQPIGERITVSGRVVDGAGRPVAGQLVEIWQANSSGRYIHKAEQHDAPVDPNFTGLGRCLTGSDGSYRFVTIKPGAYPWGNHRNAWRPAHIHFSLFGQAFTQRLITQMYFPDDSLFALDPIYQSIPDQRYRDALVAAYDHALTIPNHSLGYRWDIVLTGSRRTPTEES